MPASQGRGVATRSTGVREAGSHKICSDPPPPNSSRYLRGPSSGASLALYTAVAVLRSTKHAERFWAKVTKLNGPDACWVWTSARNQYGYGLFWVTSLKRAIPAHRLSFALAGGVVPDGLCVCHRCDNPICVRPEHLFVATHGDNLRDMVRKGRHAEQQIKRQSPQVEAAL